MSKIPTDQIQEGMSFLSKDDWFKIQSFALMSIYDNPTTPELMAARLGLKSPKDPEWTGDFGVTTQLYKELADSCGVFWNDIKPGMVNLADDIVNYQRVTAPIFTLIIKTVDEYNKADSSLPVEAKNTIIKGLKRLLKEAEMRSERADLLHGKLTGFHNSLLKAEADFNRHEGDYKKKYGDESADVIALKEQLKLCEEELETKRKKDKDETIVLGTSPLYLLIPWLGPFVLIGVLLGVGIDMGKVRERIAKLVEDAKELQGKLDIKEKFMALFKTMMDLTKDTKTEVKKVLGPVAQLKDGWAALTSDLKSLVGPEGTLTSAEREATASEWAFVGTDLEASKNTWSALGKQADKFRLNATIRKAETVDEAVQSLTEFANSPAYREIVQ